MKMLKNPENPKKHCISFVLRVLLTLAVCGYALYRCSLTAFADTVRLNPAQTLALYGTDLPMTYHNPTTGNDESITLRYSGLSSELSPDLGETQNLIIDAKNYDFGSGYETILKSAPYLIYSYQFTNASDYVPYRGTISGSFSVDLSPITEFNSCYLFSCGTGSGWGSDSPNYSASGGGSYINFATSYSASVTRYTNHYNNNTNYVFLSPTSKRSAGADIDLSDDVALQFMTLYQTSALSNSGNTFSFNSYTVNWRTPSGITGSLLPVNGRVLFYIQCPLIGDYVPPVTTTTVTSTTRPQSYTTRSHNYSHYATTPANTIDLSEIESNQRVQIEIENDNRNYNAGSFDALNIIIDQLNDIYAQMQASGEIAVDLLDGLQWSAGTDLNDYISGGLTHTTAKLPDTFNPDTINSLSDLLMDRSQFGRFAAVGIFSICFGIFCWFVFRGRGGT